MKTTHTHTKNEHGTMMKGGEYINFNPLAKILVTAFLVIALLLLFTSQAFACANCGAGMRPNHADRPLPTIFAMDNAREITREGQPNPQVPVHQNWTPIIHRPGERWQDTRNRHLDLHPPHREAHTTAVILVDSNNNLVGWWFAPNHQNTFPFGTTGGTTFRATAP